MNILKWMRQERSGLERTTLEHAKYEARLGHNVAIREPQGQLLWGQDCEPDVHTIHSQIAPTAYHDGKPRFMICHGEPLSSVGNGVSFKAILDLATVTDAMICMRRGEWPIWNMIKRTYYVPKGIDLEVFQPIEGVQRLEGEPAVLCYENIRGTRNPLYTIVAMAHVVKKLPKARLHLFNVNDQKMRDTFSAFIKHSKLWTYVRTLSGGVKQQEVPGLLNRADIVVSNLYPLSARGIEALGCGKAYVSAGYDGGEGQYPWIPESLSVEAFADTIINCYENYDKINYREYAETYHDEAESSKQRVAIYERYLG